MTLHRQLAFWGGGLIALLMVTYLLRGILAPFVAGLALAYLFDPIVRRLTGFGLPRSFAAFLVIATFVIVVIGLAIVVVPILANQLTAFVSRLPGYVVQLQTLATDQNREWMQWLMGEGRLTDVTRSVSDLVTQSVGWMLGFIQGLWTGGAAFLFLFSLVIVTPVVGFYLLSDWPRLMAKIETWLPLKHKETIVGLVREIDRVLAGFVRGQATVCLTLMIYYAAALVGTGLNFGLLIGLTTGFLSFVPYVGSLTGLILAVGVAIVQFWPNWSMVVIVLGIFAIGQFLEAYILYPNLVGESVGLHPVWLLFSLFAFSALFGFVGLLLAVPMAAAIGVIARFAIKRYLASPLYTGTDHRGPAARV